MAGCLLDLVPARPSMQGAGGANPRSQLCSAYNRTHASMRMGPTGTTLLCRIGQALLQGRWQQAINLIFAMREDARPEVLHAPALQPHATAPSL